MSADRPLGVGTVFTIMTHGMRTVRPDLSIDSLIHLFMVEGLSRVLVVSDDGAPIGVVSKSDVVCMRYLSSDAGEPDVPLMHLRRGITSKLGWGFHLVGPEKTVADIMTNQVVTVGEDASINEACELMVRARVNGLPVVSGPRGPIGWISSMDVVQWIASRGARAEAVSQLGAARV